MYYEFCFLILLLCSLFVILLLCSLFILSFCSLFIILLLCSLLYPGIYAEGYIAYGFPFVHSYVRSFVCLFVRSLLSITFLEVTSKFLVKVSLSEYISLTTHQKAFIFEPWVSERVIIYAMSFGPRVHALGWG